MESLIRNRDLMKKVTSAEEAAGSIADGSVIAIGGLPKVILPALAKRTGDISRIDLWSLTTNTLIDQALAEAGMIRRRFGTQACRPLANQINSQKVFYGDNRIGTFGGRARSGFYGEVDVAIIEAGGITEKGELIPPCIVSDMPLWVRLAKRIMIEINTTFPKELEGIHDIYFYDDPPRRKPIAICSPLERIGTPYVPLDKTKVSHIVKSLVPDPFPEPQPLNDTTVRIAENLVSFFAQEAKQGRLPKNLLPIELGLGQIPSAVLKALAHSDFSELEIYSAVLDVGSAIDLLEKGKLKGASSAGLLLTDKTLEKFIKNHLEYKKYFIVRSVEIADCPEILSRLGIIALNTALEIDIYGNVNSSHISGSRVVNGLGGSMDFSASSFLSVFLAASTSGDGSISNIVPMVTHVDHTEHMVDVIVTEQGIADLRKLDPKERAEAIIGQCAHPDYRPLLREYFQKACREVGGHIPHLLEEAFSFHLRFKETKTMRETKGKTTN